MEELLLAFFGSFFPAILFNTEKKNLGWAGVSGLVGWTVYKVLTYLTGMPVLATFFGAAAIGFYSEIMARRLKTPASVLSISGMYPLVPGITAYLVVENIVTGNLSAALNKGIETLSYAGAIAFGIMFVTTSMQFQAKYKEFFKRKKKSEA
ncbi:MAG: threonine/serine exporter [Clostridiales bacterium]|nr:threonine/serine exporter [Clostridiales bacterium]